MIRIHKLDILIIRSKTGLLNNAFQKVVLDEQRYDFSLSWLSTFTKSFASLVCRLVSLFRRCGRIREH